MQTTLSAFVSAPKPRTHFLLRDEDAVFLHDIPQGVLYVGICNVRIGVETVCLTLYRETELSQPVALFPKVTDISLLVSMLQKAVRRSLPDVATRVATELCHVNILSLTRRLPIIAVEDVNACDRSITRAVWFSLAFSKNYGIMENDFKWCVSYATALASSLSRDVRFRDGTVPSPVTCWKRASQRGDHVSMSLVCRACYGGMKGDVQMLLRAADVDMIHATPLEIRPCVLNRLTYETSIPEAVDFHCEPSMLSVISKLHGVSEDDVKHAIWNNSSKRNIREMNVEPETPFWIQIRNDVTLLQTKRLRRSIEYCI